MLCVTLVYVVKWFASVCIIRPTAYTDFTQASNVEDTDGLSKHILKHHIAYNYKYRAANVI